MAPELAKRYSSHPAQATQVHLAVADQALSHARATTVPDRSRNSSFNLGWLNAAQNKMSREGTFQAVPGCATYRWNLGRATCLPVIFKLAIEMAAAESQDRVCSSNGPEHS